MRMRHEYEVNRRQVLDFEARSFQSFDDLEPFRPNRIDQDVDEAWPIHVMQISPSRIFGNCGGTYSPDRFTNSDGIKTLVRKLRLCQSDRGRSRTRVECRPAGTEVSPSGAWRTIFRRFFFGKRIGTVLERYGTVTKWKALKRYKLQTWDSPSVRHSKPLTL